jgi:SnoaL-like domain
MDDDTRRLADRLEIDDLLTRYATAIDGRDWELLDTVFTADAHLDYRGAGGIEGPYPEVRAWLAEVLPMFDVTQHLVLNRVVAVDGDTARARSAFSNPNRINVDGASQLFTVGGYYHDQLVRTPDGWRLSRRLEETSWWEGAFPGLPPSPPELAEPPPPTPRP